MSTSPTPGRFQFSLARIFWTMFVCSVLAAVVRALGLPLVLQIPLLVLLLVYAGYAIFRLPHVLGDLRGQSQKWRRIHERREQLHRDFRERRAAVNHPDTATAEGTPPGSAG